VSGYFQACGPNGHLHPFMLNYHKYFNIASSFSSVILYVVLLFVNYFRTKVVAGLSSGENVRRVYSSFVSFGFNRIFRLISEKASIEGSENFWLHGAVHASFAMFNAVI
jgi:hypothetical protein